MPSMTLGRGDVIVGVDTHKDEHVAVAIDGLGGRLGELNLVANPLDYTRLMDSATEFGLVARFGVEGTGSYGSGVARFLRRNGHQVIEVGRPPRKGERRMSGKSDSIDAEHAAREVLAGKATATPKLADGIVEAIRLVKTARDTAVKAHTTAIITLKATLVTGSDKLRAELEPFTDFKLVTACAALSAGDDLADPAQAMRHVLRALARRWLELHEEIKIHSRQLKKLTKTAAPELVAAFGVGPDIAAEMLVAPATTPTASGQTLLSPSCAVPAPSQPRRARRPVGIGSAAAETAKPTQRSTDVSSCGCVGTRRRSPMSNDAQRRASRRRTSSDALNVSWPEKSSPFSQHPAPRSLSRQPHRSRLTSTGASTLWPRASTRSTSGN